MSKMQGEPSDALRAKVAAKAFSISVPPMSASSCSRRFQAWVMNLPLAGTMCGNRCLKLLPKSVTLKLSVGLSALSISSAALRA